jgi:hypothetical protein
LLHREGIVVTMTYVHFEINGKSLDLDRLFESSSRAG